MKQAYAFDLDGTLWTAPEGLYEDPDAMRRYCEPIRDAVRRLRGLVDAGHPVALVTGRRRPVHEAVTRQQIADFLGDDVLFSAPLFMQEAAVFEWRAFHTHKHDALRWLQARGWWVCCYVGDQDADQAAAASDGVPFLRADAFARGEPWPRKPPLPATEQYVDRGQPA